MAIVGALSFIVMNRFLGHDASHAPNTPNDGGGVHIPLEEVQDDIIRGDEDEYETRDDSDIYDPSPTSDLGMAASLSLSDAVAASRDAHPRRPRSNSLDSEKGVIIGEILEEALPKTPRKIINDRLKTRSVGHMRCLVIQTRILILILTLTLTPTPTVTLILIGHDRVRNRDGSAHSASSNNSDDFFGGF